MEIYKDRVDEPLLDLFEEIMSGGGVTVNRYDSIRCKSITKADINCKGFLNFIPCDHFTEKRSFDNDDKSKSKWNISCEMRCFPAYSESREHSSGGGY